MVPIAIPSRNLGDQEPPPRIYGDAGFWTAGDNPQKETTVLKFTAFLESPLKDLHLWSTAQGVHTARPIKWRQRSPCRPICAALLGAARCVGALGVSPSFSKKRNGWYGMAWRILAQSFKFTTPACHGEYDSDQIINIED